MASYGLEVLEKDYCTDELLEIFSRAHMSYINQIFGDATIREIIQDVYAAKGKLVIEPAGANFEHSVHHVYYADENENENYNENNANAPSRNIDFTTSKVCSLSLNYQDLTADNNDTLCQSYSLMAYLGVHFDSTPSKVATREQKFNKQLSMINMYRDILDYDAFKLEFNAIVKDKRNNKLWTDSVDPDKNFYIIQKFKTPANVVKQIRRVLDVWEKYGWQFFVEDGKCKKLKQDGGVRKTKKNRLNRSNRSKSKRNNSRK